MDDGWALVEGIVWPFDDGDLLTNEVAVESGPRVAYAARELSHMVEAFEMADLIVGSIFAKHDIGLGFFFGLEHCEVRAWDMIMLGMLFCSGT